MSNPIYISDRDRALFKLLEMTPATALHLRKASVTFPDEPFRDERRVRERLQSLSQCGFVRAFPIAVSGGGLSQYYRLTLLGYRAIHPYETQQPSRMTVTEIAPSRFAHAMAVADIIVHILVACHASRVSIVQFHGDGRLVLSIGEYRQQPDCHFQFEFAGKLFNVLFEIDNATEPLESSREHSIRTKLLGFEAYQDWVLETWKRLGRNSLEPRFRVVFLTKGNIRAKHILWLARQCAKNPERRLCLASTQAEYLSEQKPVTSPILIDHQGTWQSLIDLHPTSQFTRKPVRLSPPLAQATLV
jgi:hypothetical protein